MFSNSNKNPQMLDYFFNNRIKKKISKKRINLNNRFLDNRNKEQKIYLAKSSRNKKIYLVNNKVRRHNNNSKYKHNNNNQHNSNNSKKLRKQAKLHCLI